MIRPGSHALAGRENLGHFAGCCVTQRDRIDGLAPGCRFLGATGGHHLSDDGRQRSGRVLPADQIEALKRLVDEVERMAGVGESPLGSGRPQGIGEHRR